MEGIQEPVIRPKAPEMSDDEFAVLHDVHNDISNGMNNAPDAAGPAQVDAGPNDTIMQPAVNVAPNIPAAPANVAARSQVETRAWRRAFVGLGIGIAAVSGGILLAHNTNNQETSALSAPNDGSDISPNQVKNFRDSLNVIYPNAQPGDLAIGKDVNFNADIQNRGSHAFSKKSLGSREGIKNWLASDDPNAQAELAKLTEHFKDHPELLASAVNANAYVPVQAHPKSTVYGNTYIKNGQEGVAGPTDEGVEDIVWMYVNPDGTIDTEASIRDNCANRRVTKIILTHPTPPTTVVKHSSTTRPHETTVPHESTTTPTTARGKQHTDSPVVSDPDAPDERTRPRTTEPERTPDTTATTRPNSGDSGPGETNTSTPPTTSAPPETVPPSQPPNSGTVPPR